MSRETGPYHITIAGTARRRLEKLDQKTNKRLTERIVALAENPRPNGTEKLTDRGDLYRIRVGDYRVVYAVKDEERAIIVADVGHRSDIYRKGGY